MISQARGTHQSTVNQYALSLDDADDVCAGRYKKHGHEISFVTIAAAGKSK